LFRSKKGKIKGRIIYADQGAAPLLVDNQILGVYGKPDLVIEKNNGLMIKEYKSGYIANNSKHPYKNDLLQLLTYCHLSEINFRKRVIGGVVQYKNKSITVYWDHKNKELLKRTIEEMRKTEEFGIVNPTPLTAKCGKCIYINNYCQFN
jgi:CRISPR/Cas system-associated exonuclease Cas4 (RecB family)